MSPCVSHLWRHPIKGCGVEAVARVDLEAGATMPWDRVWAIAHDAARLEPDDRGWIACPNFCRGARTPAMMAIRAAMNERDRRISLRHPLRPDIEVDPDDVNDARRLVAWLTPLCDPDRVQPAGVVRTAQGRGMTDSDFPSISLHGRASLEALARRLGRPLAMERFRGNVWLDGLEPWQEFEWVGRTLRLGGATIVVRERITRCRATMADPDTGLRDADTLGALQGGWGHQDFGVCAEVVADGPVAVGDAVRPE